MAEYRLGSSSLVHTPGLIAWAINGYHFEEDRPQLLGVIAATYRTCRVRHWNRCCCARSTIASKAKPLCSPWRATMPAREPDQPITIHCPSCGGQNILADACARWNVETQEWELSNVFDHTICDDCGIEVSAVERPVQEGA